MKLTKQICYIACFIALFILLDILPFTTILIPGLNVRVTFRNLPLYIGAYIFGPFIGGTIGFLGMIVSQFKYSIDLMSVLFLLPQTLIGLLTGIFAKYRILDINKKNFVFIMIVLNLILSIVNTICIFIRYIYYGADIRVALVTSALEFPIRLLGSVITALVYAMIMPYIIRLLKNFK